MNFCTKCGSKLNGEKFCPKCGTPTQADGNAAPVFNQPQNNQQASNQQQYAAPGYAATPVSPVKKKNPARVIIPIVVVVVLITAAAIGAYKIFGGSGYEETLEAYVTAANEGDTDTIISCIPDEWTEYMVSTGQYNSTSDLRSNISTQLAVASLISMQFDYEIVNVEDYTSEDIQAIEDKYEEEGIDINIKAGKTVTLNMTYTFDSSLEDYVEDEGEDDETAIELVKIGNKWYIWDEF